VNLSYVSSSRNRQVSCVCQDPVSRHRCLGRCYAGSSIKLNKLDSMSDPVSKMCRCQRRVAHTHGPLTSYGLGGTRRHSGCCLILFSGAVFSHCPQALEVISISRNSKKASGSWAVFSSHEGDMKVRCLCFMTPQLDASKLARHWES